MTANENGPRGETRRKKCRRAGSEPGFEPAVPSTYMTVAEVADLLRTTPAAIYARIERGLLPGVVKDGRRRLVEREILIEWLAKRRATSLGVDPR